MNNFYRKNSILNTNPADISPADNTSSFSSLSACSSTASGLAGGRSAASGLSGDQSAADRYTYKRSAVSPFDKNTPEILLFTKKHVSERFRIKRTLLSLLLSLVLISVLPMSGTLTVNAAEGSGSNGDNSESGEGNWSETYYRANDTTGDLSQAEQTDLDRLCLEFMKTWHVDLGLLALRSDEYPDLTLSALAMGYYIDSEFGYGPDQSGFQMVWYVDTEEVLIAPYGSAQGMIPQSYLEFVQKTVPGYKEKYGVHGGMYATVRFLSKYLSEHGAAGTAGAAAVTSDGTAAEDDSTGTENAGDAENEVRDELSDIVQNGTLEEEGLTGTGRSIDEGGETNEASEGGSTAVLSDGSGTDTAGTDKLTGEEKVQRLDAGNNDRPILPEGEIPDESLRVGEDSGLPAWYPKDIAAFPFYHDEKAPRVVDTADIFTDEEEAQMEARLKELRGQLSKDIVVFTDNSTYGFTHTQYADDYFDYNGYGIGDDFEGVCLMICMDPNDRGWWTSCCGPVTRDLYSQTIANQIDDLLYEYMVSGMYGEGVADWIENFRRLYTTGSPYSEEWALMSKDSFTRFHDQNAPRVVDDADILRPGEINSLTDKALALSEKYGIDVVIHTVRNEGILNRGEYGDLFYYFHGYGFGDDYDGIQLTIFKRPGESGDVTVSASGKGLDKLTQVNQNRLSSRCRDVVLEQNYYEAAEAWLSQTDHMLRTGRAPRSDASWMFSTVVELLAGILFGSFSLSRAKARMQTPEIKENANNYLVRGSLKIRNVADQFLNSTMYKSHSPRPKQRSGGGRSGGSSYSGGHSSSSGRTHSGSGRRF